MNFLYWALIVLLILVLVYVLSDAGVYIFLLGAVLLTGWAAYKLFYRKVTGASTLEVNAHAKKELLRREKEACQDEQMCRQAPQTSRAAVGGEGVNSLCSTEPDKCPPCYDGVPQPTLASGNFCGIEDDPNFAPYGARHSINMSVTDDHYAADGHKALYMDQRNRIYRRDRNQMIMARSMLNGSTRPPSTYAHARQGWNSLIAQQHSVKSDRYMVLVDPRMENTEWKDQNFA